MNKLLGFTLIELVLFIAITSILVTGILMAFASSVSSTPSISQSSIASLTASQCANWYLGQRRVMGYSSFTCSNSMTLPTVCAVPTGYNLAVSCSGTTVRGDNSYETLTFTVTGTAGAKLSLLLGDY